MSSGELLEYLKDTTDILEDLSTISRWNKDGLLGEVPIREGGAWPDYETVKERAFVVCILLGYTKWSYRKVKKLFEMAPEDSERELLELIEKVEIKVLPRFKQIVMNKWKEIAKKVEVREVINENKTDN